MIIYAAYRRWALDALPEIKNCKRHPKAEEIMLVYSPTQLLEALEENEIDYILFIGWSWIVDPRIVKKIPCYAFHPSDLPKFRGGSPLQNQIIRGITETKGTLFRMTDQVDAGGIIYKEDLSLRGTIDEIFTSLKYCVVNLVSWFNNWSGIYWLQHEEWPVGEPQDEEESTWYRRRQPEESELTFGDFYTQSAEYIHNKIRMLGAPYPNAYVICKDGTKLYLTSSHLEKPRRKG